MAAASGPVFYQLYYIGGREASAPIIERVPSAPASRASCSPSTPRLLRVREIAATANERASRRRSTCARRCDSRPRRWPSRAGWPTTCAAARSSRRWRWGCAPTARRWACSRASRRSISRPPRGRTSRGSASTGTARSSIKGILTAEDARRAVAEGVDAIVVSNHGGNVLDGSVPTLRVLPEIVDAVGDEIEVLMDGGVRRGTDVVKAVALGAKAVLLGRAYVYPLLAAGEPGVRRILELFHQQIDEALALPRRRVGPRPRPVVPRPPRRLARAARGARPRRFVMTSDEISRQRLWHLGARRPDHRSRPGRPVGRRSGRPGGASSRRSPGAGTCSLTRKACQA